jgi:AbrB family looped-hinge helix DNA binding protein
MTMETAVVTTKGQLVIPIKLRKKLGIKKGTRVALHEDNGRLIVQPLTSQFIGRMRGSLGARGEKA